MSIEFTQADRAPGIMAGAMPVLISYVDSRQRFRFNNSAFEKWFRRTPESICGMHLCEFFGVESYGDLRPFVDAALSGRQVTFELGINRYDGEQIFTQFIFVPQISPSGHTVGFYALVTDLSQIRRSQEALSHSEALYHSLVDQLPMCLLHKDVEGRFTFANRRFYEFADKTPDDVIGQTDFDLFPEELAEKYRQDDSKVVKSGQILDTIELHQLEGESGVRYVQILKTPVYGADRQVIGSQVLFWDVTEKHAAEEALKESTALKRAIFDSALDCIVMVDQSGVIIDVNRSAERVFGYSRQELIGRNMDNTLFPPGERERTQTNRERYESRREEGSMLGKRAEMSAMRKDGRVFDVEMAMQPIPYEGQTVFAMFLHDITERKEAEAEIAQKNKDLETLLYVTSHDLREPLRAIRSFSQLLNDRAGEKLEENERVFLTRVIDGAERLDRLLEDVLTLSRAQRASEKVEAVDSSIVLKDVLRQLDVRLNETGGRVTVVGELPEIRADIRWLRQSLFNLVANSLKFRKDEEPPEVEIAPYEPRPGDEELTGLVVRDRGPGVPVDQKERVFQLFQRGVSRKVEGTGAGLAIVKQVSNRYGGDAWYESRPGGGSQFFITFSQ